MPDFRRRRLVEKATASPSIHLLLGELSRAEQMLMQSSSLL